MPVLTGSVHAHILTKPSRAGFAVIRLELIEPGAETCVYQAKACSPTDQPVRKFKDGLGINIIMKPSLLYISHHVRSIAWYLVVYIYKGASRRAASAARRLARRLHAMSSAVVVFAI